MRLLLTLLLSFSAALFAATAPTDTLYVTLAPDTPKQVPVGIWKAAKKNAPVILWFHGGMTSGNCEKGLVAGSNLSQMLPSYTVVSPSACRQNHWVEPATVQAVDKALNDLAKRFKQNIAEISLVGISDGSLGVMAYSLWGKRKIRNRILMSSFGAALGPASQVALQPPMKNGNWRFIQGGNDRLYPAEKTLPWIQEFCRNVGAPCDLKFDSQGEHDWKYWQDHHKEWFLEFFSK